MRLKLITLIALFAFQTTTSQNSPISTKQYPVTAVWDFICEKYAWGGIAKVQVSKAAKGGTIKLELASTGQNFYIGGKIYVYLSDNNVITCTDKSVRQTTQTGIAAWYSFSASEMVKLSKTNIQSIRFTIKGIPTPFTSQVGNFTAVNKKSYFSGFGEAEKNYYLTAAEIAALK